MLYREMNEEDPWYMGDEPEEEYEEEEEEEEEEELDEWEEPSPSQEDAFRDQAAGCGAEAASVLLVIALIGAVACLL